ncbi:MAG: hypothetical protein KDB23_06230, partial [Planctomycetales bacterium]|nr:hypothetical protein [Planctomycetales bacterium]
FQQKLTGLRDQLKRALSSGTADSKEDVQNAAKLSARIKQMLEEKANPIAVSMRESTPREMPLSGEEIDSPQVGFAR